MSCVTQIDNIYTISCAVLCDKPNDAPVAKFRFEDFFLIDESEFYDGGSTNLRQVNWKVWVSDYLVYDFGWGYYTDIIPDIGNGSIYSIFDVGQNNQDIITLIEGLPSVNVTNKITFTITLSVKDDSGVESTITENTYLFHKIV